MNPMTYDLSLTHSLRAAHALEYLIDAFNYDTATGNGHDAAAWDSITDAGLTIGFAGLPSSVSRVQDDLKAEAAYQAEALNAREQRAWVRLMVVGERRTSRRDENKPVYQGFSRFEMEQAFHKVCDPTNWKNPIKGQAVSAQDVPVIDAAIKFYTGSIPRFMRLNPDTYWVRADGYYLTIGS